MDLNISVLFALLTCWGSLKVDSMISSAENNNKTSAIHLKVLPSKSITELISLILGSWRRLVSWQSFKIRLVFFHKCAMWYWNRWSNPCALNFFTV